MKLLDRIKEICFEASNKFVKQKPCLCCKTAIIKPLEIGDAPIIINPLKQDQSMWNDGVVFKIRAGFGSKYDCDSFYAAICDSCIEQLLKEEVIENTRKIQVEFDKSDDYKMAFRSLQFNNES